MPASDLTTPHRLTAALGREFKGEVVDPGHPDYGQARRVWKSEVDRHPALVARPIDVASVALAVRVAHDNGLALAVRGGGYGVAGTGTCDAGMVIDLSLMRDVRVDSKRGALRAQGGATWRELDHVSGNHGMATTGSPVSAIGVTGHTLSGGMGWLMRRHGLSCDNLRSIEVVTAAGRIVTVDYYRHAELFWAMRGGGGNFGVVTEVALRPHEVETVLAGCLVYRLEQAATVLNKYQEFCQDSPDEIATVAVLAHAPVEHFIPEDLRGRPVLMIGVCALGELGEAEQAVARLRDLAQPDADLLSHMSYRRAQRLYDNWVAQSGTSYSKSGFVVDLSTWLVELLAGFADTDMPRGSRVVLQQMGGAVGRVDADATAFAHRGASHFINVVGTWQAPEDRDRRVDLVRHLWNDIAPFTSGAYAGCLERDDHDRTRSAYSSSTWLRLAEVKRTWDPDNLFRLNANIPPATDAEVDNGRKRGKYASRVPVPRGNAT